MCRMMRMHTTYGVVDDVDDGNGDDDDIVDDDGKTHESFVPKNSSKVSVTSSECVIVISCPAPSTVRSWDDGM